MSSVVISNRNIINQRVVNIEQNKVVLPFNVSKEQVKKLVELLSKIKVTFLAELDKLNINSLTYNDINVKTNDRQLNNCRFTLSKTYVVTMKQNFILKVKSFYGRLVEGPARPVFSIGNETNLQAALAEATTEIDLSTINASLNNNQNSQTNMSEQPSQVLANNPLGETKIENPVNLNNNVQQVSTPTPTVGDNPTMTDPNQIAQVQPQVNNINVAEQQTVAMAPTNSEIAVPAQDLINQSKPKVKKLKGSVLAVPIVVIWLGLVFFGTLKLVTSILT